MVDTERLVVLVLHGQHSNNRGELDVLYFLLDFHPAAVSRNITLDEGRLKEAFRYFSFILWYCMA
jgi:hypothetical protein